MDLVLGSFAGNNKIYLLFFAVVLVVSCKCSLAQEGDETHQNKGFVDFNGYYDTRKFSVFTINILAKLPHRITYFSLTNYQGATGSTDLGAFYAEHNVRWAINKQLPLDLTYQYVLRNGRLNDDHRFGVRWRLHSTRGVRELMKKLNITYSANPMFIQFREKTAAKYMTIIEHVYNIKIAPNALNNRIYIGGFADQNFVSNDGKISFKWVSEHQLGIRIIDQLFAVLEYRINTFTLSQNYGLGYGLEYKIVF